ncbi:hypothetical protein C440_07992 [Haloferax mucosum ATCC BAA-1512]|uniref:Uncharacterized protein n=1 Tax=Haloferax mucosum ATCC BAA-1512 TaxID=662479 RepID=M0IE37_9EURY|nr:hypothetical protein [Haloferax mucosum]ELZ95001.1 hypothetical protein C440_07992 [Haloferax mucosum ATCC BAA-1512]
MSSQIQTFAAILIIGVVAFVGLSVAYAESGVVATTSEDITLSDAGTYVDERDAFEYGDNETVVHNGTTLTEGTDYRWNTSTGELTRLSGSSVPDGSTVTIDYAFEKPSQTTKDIQTTVSTASFALPYIVLFLAVAAVWGWLS